jgi:hypothetical protein
MVAIQLQPDMARAVVTVDGRLFTEYRYGHYACRPFFYPLLTPGGQRLTRAWPVENVSGENQDHYHHRSVYTAHGLVNGVNLWDENTGHGAMLQRGEPVVGVEADVAHIDGIIDWFGPDGQRLLEEWRQYWLSADGDLRVLDQRSEFRARYGAVTFGDTKEGGLFTLRVPTTMDAKDRGRIENANGQVYDSGQGEETTWGQRAAWVDYSGPLANGEQWGHTVVDHRGNPRHPTYWHVRGYGLFTANPFGAHDFRNDKAIDGSLTLAAGDSLTFRYRLIVHPGRGIDACPGVRQRVDAYLAS